MKVQWASNMSCYSLFLYSHPRQVHRLEGVPHEKAGGSKDHPCGFPHQGKGEGQGKGSTIHPAHRWRHSTVGGVSLSWFKLCLPLLLLIGTGRENQYSAGWGRAFSFKACLTHLESRTECSFGNVGSFDPVSLTASLSGLKRMFLNS